MAYSDDFNSMKQEAIRRVNEMQKRSQNALKDHNESESNPDSQSNKAQGSSDISSLLSGLLGSSKDGDKKLFDIGGIPIDEEKALIGMLIYILYKQGADIKLLLGLGYLLL